MSSRLFFVELFCLVLFGWGLVFRFLVGRVGFFWSCFFFGVEGGVNNVLFGGIK